MQPKWHHVAAVLHGPWKVPVVSLWYPESVHRPLGSALLQTSWRDNVRSFLPGSYCAGGRLQEEERRSFKGCLFLGQSRSCCDIPPGEIDRIAWWKRTSDVWKEVLRTGEQTRYGWDSFIALQTSEVMTTNCSSGAKQLAVKQAW